MRRDPIISIIQKLSPGIFGKILDFLEFPQIIEIASEYKYGHLTILPYISNIYTPMPTINPYNLTRCCNTKSLCMPNCNQLTDNMLIMLPSLEKLIIKSGSQITADSLKYLQNLKTLEIVHINTFDIDNILTAKTMGCLTNLEELRINSNKLMDDYFALLPNLKILVVNDKSVTPKILNMLHNMELCVINGVLVKYKSTVKNRKVVKKISHIKEVHIYAV